jgi:hypothetical protein
MNINRWIRLVALADADDADCSDAGRHVEEVRTNQRQMAANRRRVRPAPEPSPRLEVTSTELNLFVWTEYIPQDTIDCFEQVYGITRQPVNEYSSNEELYAKLNAGSANYDLVHADRLHRGVDDPPGVAPKTG